MLLLSRLIRVTIGALLIWTTPPAEAREASCAPRAEVVARLAHDFGETPRGVGIAGETRLVELFASGATGTWTLLRTAPDGTTCLMAAGHDWLGAPSAAKPVRGEPL